VEQSAWRPSAMVSSARGSPRRSGSPPNHGARSATARLASTISRRFIPGVAVRAPAVVPVPKAITSTFSARAEQSTGRCPSMRMG
jgi:hypothetical protein